MTDRPMLPGYMIEVRIYRVTYAGMVLNYIAKKSDGQVVVKRDGYHEITRHLRNRGYTILFPVVNLLT